MVTTNDPGWAESIRVRREHGLSNGAWRRVDDADGVIGVEVGYKYNMSDVQAAIGLHSVDALDEDRQRRSEIWQCYDEAFASLPVWVPPAAAASSRRGSGRPPCPRVRPSPAAGRRDP